MKKQKNLFKQFFINKLGYINFFEIHLLRYSLRIITRKHILHLCFNNYYGIKK